VSGWSAWLRLAAVTAATVSLAVTVTPPRPHGRLAWPLAAAVGAGVGALLFALVARRQPLPPGRRAAGAQAARQLLLVVYAVNEELLWRRLLLGELLAVGALTALVVSSAGFGTGHRRARRLHAATGATFGSLYLATGSLGASIAAHWVYNAFVSSLARRTPP
jgi:membrane protease YdiL (CAAX protease family)